MMDFKAFEMVIVKENEAFFVDWNYEKHEIDKELYGTLEAIVKRFENEHRKYVTTIYNDKGEQKHLFMKIY